jgi:hypothetical protein
MDGIRLTRLATLYRRMKYHHLANRLPTTTSVIRR